MRNCKRRVLRAGDLPRHLRGIAKTAIRAGWEITEGGSGHYRWWPPEGTPVTTSQSPGDHHALRNAVGDLRRAGLRI